MSDEQALAARTFLDLHVPGQPLLLPNPWDIGSAKLFASLGFAALATTSGGHAATLGRLDGGVTREEAIAHGAVIVAATPLPVSADLENGFGDHPDDVADTVAMAVAAGLAGCSIEDYTGDGSAPIYDLDLATGRIAAAAAVAHAGPVHFVLTARAENHIRGVDDLEDTIRRLQAYEAAGADVLYAPGLTRREDIAAVVGAVSRPVNVLARPGAPSVAELAELGVARVSVGGAFAYVGIAAVVQAAHELLDEGTYGFYDGVPIASRAVRSAFA